MGKLPVNSAVWAGRVMGTGVKAWVKRAGAGPEHRGWAWPDTIAVAAQMVGSQRIDGAGTITTWGRMVCALTPAVDPAKPTQITRPATKGSESLIENSQDRENLPLTSSPVLNLGDSLGEDGEVDFLKIYTIAARKECQRQAAGEKSDSISIALRHQYSTENARGNWGSRSNAGVLTLWIWNRFLLQPPAVDTLCGLR